MPDNPAVRAVAEAPCLNPDLDSGPVVPDSCEGRATKHPACALAALASSQEVKDWLAEVARDAPLTNWQGRVFKVNPGDASAVLDAILHALGDTT